MAAAASGNDLSQDDMEHQSIATADSGGTPSPNAANESNDAHHHPKQSFIRPITNDTSVSLLSATPRSVHVVPSLSQFAVRGDDGVTSSTSDQHVLQDISSDETDESLSDLIDSEDDFGTAPSSPHLGQGSEYRFQGPATVNHPVHNASSDEPHTSSELLDQPEDLKVSRASVIDGLTSTDHTHGSSRRATMPSVTFDTGRRHLNEQRYQKRASASPSSVSCDSLDIRLFAAMHFARHPHSEPGTQDVGFIPNKQLDSIITEDSVFQELRLDSPHYPSDELIRDHARYICRDTEVLLADGRFKQKSFKPVFALLAILKKSSHILEFLEEDVSDLDLPLIGVDLGHPIGRTSRTFKSDDKSWTPLRCFHQWSIIEIRNFLQYQWAMLSPSFEESSYNNIQHCELHSSHILPWINEGREEYSESGGGFATVFPVLIHEDHHKFGDPEACKRGFAIKQLMDESTTKFEREVSILQKFVGRNAHRHIVTLLATYRHYGKYHMIFYRAQGDLAKYWKSINPAPTFELKTILWVATQSKGIAEGLMLLHRHPTFPKSKEIPETPVSSAYQQSYINSRETIRETTIVRKQTDLNKTKQGRVEDSRTHPKGEDNATMKQGSLSPEEQIRYGRHGDIKPENILWFEGEKGEPGYPQDCRLWSSGASRLEE
ncbi:hypothetical protein PG984_013451 [Apiospora sp. TS-2023a]